MKNRFLLLIVSVLLFVSCSESPSVDELVNALTLSDSQPPVLLEVVSDSDRTVRLVFSEKVMPFSDSFGAYNAKEDENSIVITLKKSLEPGKSSSVNARVKDLAGNTTQVNVTVWGYNPNPAKVLINEFTTRGSDSSPDRLELAVTDSGNLAGFTIYVGTPENYDSRFIFPDKYVNKGDFIVLYWSPSAPSAASGVFASGSNAKPSSNNGVFVLSKSPSQGADVLDAVLYSSFESSQYDGWGTKNALLRATWVLERGLWHSDAINCSASTATRSVSRLKDLKDTDSSADWYVTVTSGATFGSANTSAPYVK